MKINITKKQYKTLIKCLEVTGSIYGLMGDMVDKKHKKPSNEVEKLVDVVMREADNFGMGELAMEFEGKYHVDDEYAEEILADVFQYDDYVFWDKLASELARKELAQTISEEKARELGERVMWGKLCELEEKYWCLLEEKGMEVVEIKK
ncbi:MAG: hypothetical protein U9Q85_04085 [Patescibacteria group bacterium]|nr:hypothetical protein [Patescibacteria group bacterium]